MNGYSKMRPTNKKARSMDFLDLLSSPPSTQETKANTNLESPDQTNTCDEVSKADEAVIVKNKNQQYRDSAPKEEEDANPRSTTVVGDVKLMRTCSVAPSSSSPGRFRLERQTSRRRTSSGGIQSAVKRVFSMRRSSSVSERYCRIYDQHVGLEPAFDEDDDDDDDGDAAGHGATDNNAMKTRSIRTKKKNGILKACKRLLGF